MDQEYLTYYQEVIRKRLPQSFISMYEKNHWLHDWYLKSLYIANTGPLVQAYSARGGSTLQIEFATSNNDKNILLIYRNLSGFHVSYDRSGDVSFRSATGFGQCLTSRFRIEDDSRLCHELKFEDGAIHICFEHIGYRRIINNYWS